MTVHFLTIKKIMKIVSKWIQNNILQNTQKINNLFFIGINNNNIHFYAYVREYTQPNEIYQLFPGIWTNLISLSNSPQPHNINLNIIKFIKNNYGKYYDIDSITLHSFKNELDSIIHNNTLVFSIHNL